MDEGASPEEAAEKVKQKFLGEICAPEKETYFYVGTVLKWPKSWVVIGAFYPRYGKSGSPIGRTGELFTRRRWEFIQKTGRSLSEPPSPHSRGVHESGSTPRSVDGGAASALRHLG